MDLQSIQSVTANNFESIALTLSILTQYKCTVAH